MTMTGTGQHYPPKDLSILLDIADSTLRKWAIALEEQEYFFSRTDKNKRLFSDRDVIVLKHLRNLVQVQNMSLQNAAIIVASKYKEEFKTASEQENSTNGIRSGEGDIQSILEQMELMRNQQEQLITMNQQLLQRLDEQQKYIDERLETRDKLLLESFREIQKSNQLLLTQQKEEPAENAKPKRRGILSIFSRT
ncbi:MerR family transcriptional regulator [Bacillus infantis]|uniref:MerR family transcriptional regulator n=2 Tax=Bacillus infantis TaxID=324767 RepID=A0A5D4S181_9BACI|nr:MerR family transcriptional regulator [Bacillus infantis]